MKAFVCVRIIQGRDGSRLTIPIKIVATKELADELAADAQKHYEQVNASMLTMITREGPRAVGRLSDFLLEMGVASISHGAFSDEVHEANLSEVRPIVSLS
jgi:hypothetical protein